MRKGKLLGIILAALLGAGCIFAAVSPVVFAEGSEQEPEYRIVIPEEFPLCTELVFDGALVRIEVSDLEGEILKDYLADHLLITSEDGTEVLQEYYHIYDRREDAVPVVSLFEEDGVLTACVEDCASGLITLYKIGGFADDYCILETESVSLSDPVRVQEIRVLQYLVDGVPDEEPVKEIGSEEETDSEEDPGDEDLAEEEISTDGEGPESEGEETSEFTDDEIPESVDEVTSADDESEIVADPADGSDTEEDEDSEEDASLSDAESEDDESDEADSEETVSDDDSGASDENAEEDAEVTSSDDASSVTEGPAESDSAETSEDDIPDSVE